MEQYIVERYNRAKHYRQWNDFILSHSIASFLFNRDYMDYHKKRFLDHSILLYSSSGKLIALLPANEANGQKQISVHEGLTYGQLICDPYAKVEELKRYWFAILAYFHARQFSDMYFKCPPPFYNAYLNEGNSYVFFLLQARLVRCDTSFVADRTHLLPLSGNIMREVKVARSAQYTISESKDFHLFWDHLLIPLLRDKHQTNPIHSKEEMLALHRQFPHNIKLMTANDQNGNMQAGAVLYIHNDAIHCQYIASGVEGKKSGALNFLMLELVKNYLPEKRYFDLGTANKEASRLNEGLVFWKERIGGRVRIMPHYLIDIPNHIYLR